MRNLQTLFKPLEALNFPSTGGYHSPTKENCWHAHKFPDGFSNQNLISTFPYLPYEGVHLFLCIGEEYFIFFFEEIFSRRRIENSSPMQKRK